MSAPITNRMRCLSSVSLPKLASMLAWDAATSYSTLPPAASIAARAPAVAATPLSLIGRLISPFFTILARTARVSTRPAFLSAAKSITSPATESSLYNSTSHTSCAVRERKPTFGRRRCSGIWPPSKPGLTLPLPVRAYWPLWPRPAVLPRPEPMPRPTRTRARRAPLAGFSVFRRMFVCPMNVMTAIRQWNPERLLFSPRPSALDPHQIADLLDQPAHLRAVLQFAHVVELVQAERLHAQAMLPLATVHALVQAHADRARRVRLALSLGHGRSPRSPSCRAWPRCVPAWPSLADP